MRILIFIPIALFAVVKGCFPTPDDEPTYDYVINVDSVSHLKVVNINDTVSLKFYGYIGSTICDAFKQIDITQNSNSADITVLGHHSNGACSSGPARNLNGIERKMVLTNRGLFFLNIKRPDNSFRRDTIQVN